MIQAQVIVILKTVPEFNYYNPDAEMSSSLRFNGTSIFSHNSANTHGGGAIFREDNTVLNFNGTMQQFH